MRNILIALFCCLSFLAKADNLDKWLKVEGLKTIKPILTNEKNVDNKSFEENKILLLNSMDVQKMSPKANNNLFGMESLPKWETLNMTDSIVRTEKKAAHKYISYHATYINVDAFTKAKLKLNLFVPAEIYLDGKLIKSSYKSATKGAIQEDISLSLICGKHSLIIKTISNDEKLFKANLVKDKDYKSSKIRYSLSPERGMTIEDIMNGTKLSSTSVSPGGKYILISYTRFTEKTGKNEKWSELVREADNKVVYSFRASDAYAIKWLPNTNTLSWLVANKDGKNLYKYDITNGEITCLLENMQEIENYTWANDLSYLIISYSLDYSDKDWQLKKLNGIEDRKEYFRTRSSLYKYDFATAQKSLLSWGSKSISLQDISHDSKKIIISNSRPTYSEYPYSKQNVYMLDVQTMKLDTLWKDLAYPLTCSFSPDDKQLLIQAGASAFGKIGENIKEGQMANNYDAQLFIYDLKSKKVDPITYNFNPSLQSAIWFKKGTIILEAEDKDYRFAYEYDVNTRKFNKLALPGDYIKSLSVGDEGLVAAYISCSANTPYKAYFSVLAKDKNTIIADPEAITYKNVTLGDVKDWNFKMPNGNEITGRYYLPKDFNPSKKYPLLVYYYGGTSPVSRYFGGRYPFNLFAANGYVVYVLQPSGATGFGQEFAARHQNNWCKITADEIIEGTKKFAKDHSFINSKKISCMGASYGGFTTEFLQTQTDIFACAISHAGISSISSYWGEGYWGYQYSTEATGKSFPWNRRDIYVDQSSLFNADKIKTPMLLLHGTADVNVPTGESIQLYTALKILNRDVELVLIKDSDHTVVDYNQRIMWNNTIIAYMNKYLKDQPQWWKELYPDKNL